MNIKSEMKTDEKRETGRETRCMCQPLTPLYTACHRHWIYLLYSVVCNVVLYLHSALLPAQDGAAKVPCSCCTAQYFITLPTCMKPTAANNGQQVMPMTLEA